MPNERSTVIAASAAESSLFMCEIPFICYLCLIQAGIGAVENRTYATFSLAERKDYSFIFTAVCT